MPISSSRSTHPAVVLATTGREDGGAAPRAFNPGFGAQLEGVAIAGQDPEEQFSAAKNVPRHGVACAISCASLSLFGSSTGWSPWGL